MSAPKPLKALYGARSHDAREARASTVKAHTGAGARPQEIFTPPAVVELLRRVWGEIALDPCGHPEAIVGAATTWTGHKVGTGRFRKDGTEIERWAGPGLENPWTDRTYWNPPFCELKDWIAHAAAQTGRHCGLFPARTSRTWCREYLYQVDGICWLNPLGFIGYASAHPDRLVLAYQGPDVEVLAAATPPSLGEWTRPLQRI